MNFFKLYIGDYQRDTAHLSVTEHGAYLLMLQHYYATEKPLPSGKTLHRMLRAHDKAERDAIDAVSAQFWTLTDAGLVNFRADAEIAEARPKIDAARENGRLGGRPKKTQGKPTGFNLGTQEEPNSKAIQNHSQSSSSPTVQKNTRKRSAERPEDVPESVWVDFETLRKAKKAPITETAIAGIRAEASEAGITMAEALGVCCQRGWIGFKAEWILKSRAATNGSHSFRERDQAARQAEFAAWAGSALQPRSKKDDEDVPRLAMD